MTCKHLSLRFGSGGFYVFCDECNVAWVAVKKGGTGDRDLDYDRSGMEDCDNEHRVAVPKEQAPVPMCRLTDERDQT